jgi:3-methyl-2-oxobutanoate hydroxymethyltransferase
LQLIRDARTAQDAGAFTVLMECVPAELAGEITEMLSVPTIGIGAGPNCDGQVLVTNDLLGWNSGYLPKFVRQYDLLRDRARDAINRFREDVQKKNFPGDAESFK